MTATTIDDARPRARSLTIPYPELLGLLIVAALLNLWGLSKNGFANDYYAGAVRSMASSWHAFLYGSLDSAGLMTVDKPPLALWVQALSARVFGFHSLSLLIPQALMGVASVGLVYDLVRRVWGRAGGFTAGAVLALTPISVAVSRHNNPDALLVLCVVFALWALVRGLQDGRTRWMAWAGVGVGLGFEAKMGAALLVVPGIVAAWLWVAPRGRVAAVRATAWFTAAMVAVGGAWPLLMWLTPAGSRPWISGTSDNSIWSLIIGYNGLGRLDGQAGGPGGMAGGGPGGGFGGNSLFGGSPGVFRLFGDSLGGQAGWLVGLALAGGVGLVVATRLRRTAKTGFLIGVGGAFLVTAVAFSAAKGIFHPYYTSELAPFTAALAGATVAHVAARGRYWRWIGAAAVAGGVFGEIAVLSATGTLSWAVPLITIAGIGAAAALVAAPSRWRRATLATALAVLTLAPATWAVQTLGHATNGTFPAGGPATQGFGGGPGARGGAGGGGFAPPGAGNALGGPPGGSDRRHRRQRLRRPGRGRRLRRRHLGAAGGRRVREGPRRRDDRRLQPVHGRERDPQLGRRRGRPRRLLRPREPDHAQLAGRRDPGGQDPLDLRRRQRAAQRRPHRRRRRDDGRRAVREVHLDRRPLRRQQRRGGPPRGGVTTAGGANQAPPAA